MHFVTPIILAAGRSSRMGRTKALLDFGGEPCIARVLRACRDGGAGAPVVVLGHDAAAIRAVLPDGVAACTNSDFAGTGPARSLQCGLDLLPAGADAFLLYPVDFPLVTGREVAALLERWRSVRAGGVLLVVPSHDLRRGHPALFSRALEAEVRELAPDAPLHDVLRRHEDRIEHVVMDGPAVLEDLDTPEDYRRCLDALAGIS